MIGRGSQHQRHPDLLAGPLRGGDRGLPHGLETLAGAGRPRGGRSVASFFVSRVDTRGRPPPGAIGGPDALALRGRAAIAQAKLAYQLFRHRSPGPRWEALAARGAHLQRPLWASTSTKNPAYPDTLLRRQPDRPGHGQHHGRGHHRRLRGPRHGRPHHRHGRRGGEPTSCSKLRAVGVDMDDVGRTLEDQGVAGFHQSFADLLITLRGKAHQLAQQ